MNLSLYDYCARQHDPALLAQWHPIKNLPLTPEQVLPGSEKKVWWRCSQGHEWQAEVRSRVSGCGCPVCTNRVVVPGINDLASRFPALAAEWDAANGTLSPRDVTFGAKRKVWWRCAKGHTWRVSVQSRTLDGTGCPVCAGKVRPEQQERCRRMLAEMKEKAGLPIPGLENNCNRRNER